jgi:hypothetical protein
MVVQDDIVPVYASAYAAKPSVESEILSIFQDVLEVCRLSHSVLAYNNNLLEIGFPKHTLAKYCAWRLPP